MASKHPHAPTLEDLPSVIAPPGATYPILGQPRLCTHSASKRPPRCHQNAAAALAPRPGDGTLEDLASAQSTFQMMPEEVTEAKRRERHYQVTISEQDEMIEERDKTITELKREKQEWEKIHKEDVRRLEKAQEAVEGLEEAVIRHQEAVRVLVDSEIIQFSHVIHCSNREPITIENNEWSNEGWHSGISHKTHVIYLITYTERGTANSF